MNSKRNRNEVKFPNVNKILFCNFIEYLDYSGRIKKCVLFQNVNIFNMLQLISFAIYTYEKIKCRPQIV